MKISARNQFPGRIKSIHTGAVNDEIVIAISPDHDIIAIITESSTQHLGLSEGSQVYAFIKASSIVLATDADGLVFSARNQLTGTITQASKGAVNSEIVIDAGHNIQITAVVTNASFNNLGLAVGGKVTAMFKESSVIVAAKA